MMKYILTVALGLLATLIQAQNIKVSHTFLNEKSVKSCKLRHTFHLDQVNSLESVSNENIETIIKDSYSVKQGQSDYWFKNSLLYSVDNPDDAAVVVSTEYDYKSGSGIISKLHKEGTGNPRLPYYVNYNRNYAVANVYITYKYTDGTPTLKDTLNFTEEVDIKPDGKNISPEELSEKIYKSMGRALKAQSYITTSKSIYINFPKVKAKDKALKAELETVSALLKDGKFEEAGLIYKKVHESSPSEGSSIALAFCYEFVGNYPKAAELFEGRSDFHINTRMKKKMKMLEYAKSNGFESVFIEF